MSLHPLGDSFKSVTRLKESVDWGRELGTNSRIVFFGEGDADCMGLDAATVAFDGQRQIKERHFAAQPFVETLVEVEYAMTVDAVDRREDAVNPQLRLSVRAM